MVDHVGKKLGSYHLTRLLGQGGFADVYLGEHIYLKTQAAIKVLQTRLLNEDVEAFLKEARTIANLKHPNIIQVLDFGKEDETPFLVMEYAANGTLRQRYPKGAQLPLDIIVSYTRQVASALQYAHDRKLIHRDVKPENMLLAANDDILLSDFGLALTAQSSRHQNTQDAIGTLAYMAPEQLQGKPRAASDQYALGVVVYEWLSGDRPFHGNFSEIASQHMLVPPPPLHEKVPTIAPEIERVVHTALAKDPHQRFASVQQFAIELAQACLSSASLLKITPPLDESSLSPAEPVPVEQIFTSENPPSARHSLVTPVVPTHDLPPESSQDRFSVSTTLMQSPGHAQFRAKNLPLIPTSITPVSPSGQLPVAIPSSALPDAKTAPPAQPAQSSIPGQYGQPSYLSPVTRTNQPSTLPIPLSPLPPHKQEPPKKGTSRRAFITVLAGIAGLTVLGGGAAAFFWQESQSPGTSLNPTPTQPPASQPTLVPLPTQTPTPKHTTKPTATPTHAAAPTPMPSPRPTPTPKPTPSPTPTPTPSPTPTPVGILSQGVATLAGSYSFNFDAGSQVIAGGDVLWHLYTSVKRLLEPKGFAFLTNIGVTDFSQVTFADLQKIAYSNTPINGSNNSSNHLVVGDVFAVLTNGGHHAKVKVLFYGTTLKIRWVTYLE